MFLGCVTASFSFTFSIAVGLEDMGGLTGGRSNYDLTDSLDRLAVVIGAAVDPPDVPVGSGLPEVELRGLG